MIFGNAMVIGPLNVYVQSCGGPISGDPIGRAGGGFVWPRSSLREIERRLNNCNQKHSLEGPTKPFSLLLFVRLLDFIMALEAKLMACRVEGLMFQDPILDYENFK